MFQKINKLIGSQLKINIEKTKKDFQKQKNGFQPIHTSMKNIFANIYKSSFFSKKVIAVSVGGTNIKRAKAEVIKNSTQKNKIIIKQYSTDLIKIKIYKKADDFWQELFNQETIKWIKKFRLYLK